MSVNNPSWLGFVRVDKTEDGRMFIRAQTKQMATDHMVILPGAFKKQIKAFKENPVFLASHTFNSPGGKPTVLGRVEDVGFDDDGMFGYVRWINPEDLPPEAAETKDLVASWRWLYENGFVRAISISWPRKGMKMETDQKPVDKLLSKYKVELTPEERASLYGVITEAQLSEISAVAVGADKGALAHISGRGSDLVDNLVRSIDAGIPYTRLWEETENEFRFRIRNPDLFAKEGMGTNQQFASMWLKESKPRVRAIIGKLKGQEDKGTKIQALRFPKEDGWSMGDAKKWVKEHPDVKREEESSAEDIEIFERGVIPAKNFGIAEQGLAWDAGKETKAASVEDLMKMSAWYDGEGKNKTDFKLPHHRQSDKKAVWNGVRAAMGVILGARGGLKGEAVQHRQELYDHLKFHYEQFEKEIPDFRSYSPAELRMLNDAGKILWTHDCFIVENLETVQIQRTAIDTQVKLVCSCGEMLITSDLFLGSTRQSGNIARDNAKSYIREVLSGIGDQPQQLDEELINLFRQAII